jgi:crotonobetainyl-CoA:carnitine CoA-transferase CaiB-like acyl-CoA transferase
VPRFARQPGGIRWLGKNKVGVDTGDVLSGLGYSAAEIDALEAKGVIRRAPEAAEAAR